MTGTRQTILRVLVCEGIRARIYLLPAAVHQGSESIGGLRPFGSYD